MHLTLVRHGQTADNGSGIFQTPASELSAIGIEQARKVAERLKNEQYDLIFSSDWKRAKDTAQYIAQFHQHLEIIFDERLRERFNGSYAGKPFGWYEQMAAEQGMDVLHVKAPDGESWHEMHTRALAFLEEIRRQHHGKRILVVSHGGPLTRMLMHLANAAPDQRDAHRLSNTAVSVVDLHEAPPKLVLFNDTTHLN